MRVYCIRDGAVGTHVLDTAAVTAVSGAVCAVPIVWRRATGTGAVWAKRMYDGLGIGARSWPLWETALEQLKRLGARLCTGTESRLLRTLPGVSPTMSVTYVMGVHAASRWLVSVGQPEAARQLSERKPPRQAAAHSGTAHQSLMGPAPASKFFADAQSLPSGHSASEADEETEQTAAPRRSNRIRKPVCICRCRPDVRLPLLSWRHVRLYVPCYLPLH